MATKIIHRHQQSSTNDTSLNKTEGKNYATLENLSVNNLSIFYNKDDSQFKKKIDKLNSKFYIETDKYLSLKSEIEKTQDSLYILLFKQIAQYIEEIERLNFKLKEKDNKEKNSKTKLDRMEKKEDISEKEINQFKIVIWNLEKQNKELKENEIKLKKENESFRRQMSHYKDQLNFEISERNKNKEHEHNLIQSILSCNENLENSQKEKFSELHNSNNEIPMKTCKNIIQSTNANNTENTFVFNTTIKKIENLNNITVPEGSSALQKSNLQQNSNMGLKKKPNIPSVNFSESNKKNQNLNLISKVKNKRSISNVIKAPIYTEANAEKLKRKNKNPSDGHIAKTQNSLNDNKVYLNQDDKNQIKNMKFSNNINRKEKLKNYLSHTVGKTKSSETKSEKEKTKEGASDGKNYYYNFNNNYNTLNFERILNHKKADSALVTRKISNFDELNCVSNEGNNFKNELADLLIGNFIDELESLKNQEEILISIRNDIGEGKIDLNLSVNSFKSFREEACDNLPSNEMSKQTKTDDTQNHYKVNTSKNKIKLNSISNLNGMDSKLKNNIKGVKVNI
jgi:reticulocyte-binding protein